LGSTAQKIQHDAIEYFRLLHVRHVPRACHDDFAHIWQARRDDNGDAETTEVIPFAAFVADAVRDGEGLLVEVNGARQASSGLRTAAGLRFKTWV
jgi:hypothetical protein